MTKHLTRLKAFAFITRILHISRLKAFAFITRILHIYMIWTVIIDRLRQSGARKVLEIGCGTGQLVSAIRDAEVIEDYFGFDFSSKGIEQARIACPQYYFEVADALKTDLIEKTQYDMVITTEFLEHVDGDLEVIRQIHAGSRFLATVPNFPYVSHVRHFNDSGEVMRRYEGLFDDFSVIMIPANEKSKIFFLVEGRRNSDG